MRVLTMILAIAITACGYAPEDNDTITDIRVKKECEDDCKKDKEVVVLPVPVADPIPPERNGDDTTIIIVNGDECCEDDNKDCPICPQCPQNPCKYPDKPSCPKVKDPKSICNINRNINNNNNNNVVIR